LPTAAATVIAAACVLWVCTNLITSSKLTLRHVLNLQCVSRGIHCGTEEWLVNLKENVESRVERNFSIPPR
jgi:hypothetical protein